AAWKTGTPAGLAVAPPSLLAAVVCRSRETAWIGERLESLPLDDRARVLSSLEQEPLADTRRIVRALKRRCALPTELAPANLRDSRGDEAMPAENASDSR